MAAVIAKRTASAFFSTAVRLAVATPLRHFTSHQMKSSKFPDLPDNHQPHRPWSVHDAAEGTIVRLDIPGLRPSDVKVWKEANAVLIEGVETDPDPTEPRRDCSGVIMMPPGHSYATDHLRCGIANGCLFVVMLKTKEEADDMEESCFDLFEIEVK